MSKDLNFRELSFLIYKAKKKIDKIRSDTASLNYKYKKTYSMKRTTICFSTLLIANALSAQVIEHFPQLGKDNTDSVIAAMTLQEKVNVVTGLGDDTWTNPPQGKATVIINGIAGCTYDIPHLGITPTVMADGPAGLRIDPLSSGNKKPHYCIAYPTATVLASTWNTSLVEEVGKAMGNEVLEYGCDVLLSPAMNIQRNPLAGRNFEYYSEDPLLSGKMGAAMVRGLQSNGIGACVKHFVANNQETNRKSINEVISQRALREIYLRGFEIAIKESNPWVVMSSYNRVNGFHTAENRELLTTILRNEWGFKGMVTTDWWSGTDATSQMYAGNDMLMPGCYQRKELLQAVKTHRLSENILDQNIKRILNYVVQTPRFKGYRYTNNPNLTAHALTALKAAEEGIILLSNKNKCLPLKKKNRVALFGKTSYSFIPGGTGSGEVNYNYTASLNETLKQSGFKVNASLESYYMHFADSLRTAAKEDNKHAVDFAKEPVLSLETIRSQTAQSDVAIVTLGRNAGEGWDRKEQDYFLLSNAEKNLVEEVCKSCHEQGKKVIVVLNIGSVIETTSWKELPDAILLAWQSGQKGADALAEIIRGNITPSGKLPVTFPEKYSDVPSATTFPGEPAADPINSFYNEGIYVGYRYYDSFNVTPSYAFGYGLSYTNFKYSNLQLNFDESALTLKGKVTLTNVGHYNGKEVVQVYLSAPTDNIERPEQELEAFVKTKELKPGESETVCFELHGRSLSSFWNDSSEWVADKGIYQIKVGASSKDIRLQGSFTLKQQHVIEKDHYVLQPNYEVKELSTHKEIQP